VMMIEARDLVNDQGKPLLYGCNRASMSELTITITAGCTIFPPIR
jgi:hypothetical protein